jgi:hypothetical protein
MVVAGQPGLLAFGSVQTRVVPQDRPRRTRPGSPWPNTGARSLVVAHVMLTVSSLPSSTVIARMVSSRGCRIVSLRDGLTVGVGDSAVLTDRLTPGGRQLRQRGAWSSSAEASSLVRSRPALAKITAGYGRHHGAGDADPHEDVEVGDESEIGSHEADRPDAHGDRILDDPRPHVIIKGGVCRCDLLRVPDHILLRSMTAKHDTRPL